MKQAVLLSIFSFSMALEGVCADCAGQEKVNPKELARTQEAVKNIQSDMTMAIGFFGAQVLPTESSHPFKILRQTIQKVTAKELLTNRQVPEPMRKVTCTVPWFGKMSVICLDEILELAAAAVAIGIEGGSLDMYAKGLGLTLVREKILRMTKYMVKKAWGEDPVPQLKDNWLVNNCLMESVRVGIDTLLSNPVVVRPETQTPSNTPSNSSDRAQLAGGSAVVEIPMDPPVHFEYLTR